MWKLYNLKKEKKKVEIVYDKSMFSQPWNITVAASKEKSQREKPR